MRSRCLVGIYTGDANFGFNFTCDMETAKKAVIKGQITYHDDPSTIVGGAPTVPRDQAPRHRGAHRLLERRPMRDGGGRSCSRATIPVVLTGVRGYSGGPVRGHLPVPGQRTLQRSPTGQFTVLVGDQGEPGRPGGEFNGDRFSIELFGGPYTVYTRGGYIEGGNIQVES